MRTLEKILLAGTALITLGTGLVYGCKKDYPITPTQPTPIVTPAPTQEPTPTLKPYIPTPKPIEVPTPTTTPTAKPEPNNSYDFAKSLGLEADYLRGLNFDNNAKDFISYLASSPAQMRAIAERSGLTGKLLGDTQISQDEMSYFKKIIGSYQKDIDMMKPWLIPEEGITEKDITDALALNLSNFYKASKADDNGKIKMIYTLNSDSLPSLLPKDLFVVDGISRKYAAEVINPDGWNRTVKPYASSMVKNIKNFNSIHDIAWKIANDPNNDAFATDPLAKEYFRLNAAGSNDAGVNAYEDIKLLAQSGSPAAKAALRLYYWNLGEGNKSTAGQARVELTVSDGWSLGIPSYEVVLAGHDVLTIPLTLDDIALLKSRSADSLLILDVNGSYHLPLQWTRKSIVKKEWEEFSLYNGTKAIKLKVSDLKPY